MFRLLTLFAMVVAGTLSSAEPFTVEQAIRTAYKKFPRLAAQKERALAEDTLVTSEVTPSSPMLGISELNRGTTTTYATIRQKIEFPSKYVLRGKAQKYRSKAEHNQVDQLRLEIRSKVIATYYALYAIQQIIQLNEQDLSRLKEISRIAESKYAARKAPQHDQMKAHVAHTETETKLIALRQEEETLQAHLTHLLHEDVAFKVNLRTIKPEVPNVTEALLKLDLNAHPPSPEIQKMKNLTKATEAENALAGWSFAPDFEVKYQHRVAGAPDNSHIIGIEMSIPLWFWGNGAESRAASRREVAAKKELMHVEHLTSTQLRTLKSQLLAEFELYEIFGSSMIPQALSSYNSATSAYRANKISFNDYLDTERALLKVKIARLRTLTKYISTLAKFEALFGQPISGLGEPSAQKGKPNEAKDS